jgi:hypothetical protein
VATKKMTISASNALNMSSDLRGRRTAQKTLGLRVRASADGRMCRRRDDAQSNEPVRP